jgi:hypothetical protein
VLHDCEEPPEVEQLVPPEPVVPDCVGGEKGTEQITARNRDNSFRPLLRPHPLLQSLSLSALPFALLVEAAINLDVRPASTYLSHGLLLSCPLSEAGLWPAKK